MTASIWNPGSVAQAATGNGTVTERATLVGGQTLINLSLFTYTPGANALKLFMNGLLLTVGVDYLETSSSSLTLTSAATLGDEIECIGIINLIDILQPTSGNPEVDIAVATTTDIGGASSSFIRIVGSGTINSFGTNFNGPIFIRFTGACTLTNGAALVLPGSTNLVVGAGYTCLATPKATSGLEDGWIVSDLNGQRKSVYVTDFGPKGDGVTQDDAPLFNAAIASGVKHIIAPWTGVPYLFLSPVNMTTGTALTVPPARACGITLDFQTSTDLNIAPNGTCPIIVKHTGVALDMSGSRDCVINNMLMHGDATITPKVMILSARNSAGSDCGRHRFNNVRSAGYWSVAPLYLYGSEENDFFGCHMQNNQAGKGVVTVTGNNIQSMASTFITIATGGQSTTVNNFWGGSYWSIGNSGSVNESVFYLDACADLNIDGPHLFCPYGIAYVYVSAVNGACDYIRVKDLRGEVSGALQPLHGVYFAPAGSLVTHAGFCFSDSRVPCGTGIGTGFMVYGGANIGLTAAMIEGLSNSIGNGLSILNLSHSNVRLQSQLVIGRAGGVFTYNQIIGVGSQIQLSGTNDNQLIYDEGTFTPTLTCGTPGNLTIVYGTRTGKYTRVGRQVTVQISIVTTTFTHTTASGIVSISGLPAGLVPAAGAVMAPMGAFGGFTSAGFTQLGAQFSGTTSVYVVKSGSAQALTNCPITDFPTAGTINLYMTLSYFI